MRKAFALGDFRRLFAGVAATLVGDSVLLLVLSIWVKDLTGSSAAAGFTFFWLVLPSVIAPLLGWVVDRFPRRTFLVWGNLASTLTVAPLLLVDQADDLWILYAAAFGYGMSFVMLPAAMNGMLKLILAEYELVDGNAAIGTTKEALRIAGPIAGAGLYTVAGPHVVVAANIVAYVVAAVIIARLRVDGDRVDRASMSTRGSLLVGLRHVRNDPLLMHPLVGVGLALVVFGFTESAAYALIDDYDKPAAYVGVLVTVQGVGAVLGGVLASPLIKRIGEPHAIIVSLTLFVAGTTGTAVAPAIGFVLAAVVPIGFGLPLMIIALMTLLQRRTPAAIIGRVSTAFDVVLGTPQTVSIAVGAMLVTLIDYRAIFAIMAVMCVVAAAYLAYTTTGKPGRTALTASDPASIR